jgi:hypothetical protein
MRQKKKERETVSESKGKKSGRMLTPMPLNTSRSKEETSPMVQRKC